MAFVVIRLIYVDFGLCQKKILVQGTKMGWAITYFQSWVATLQCCYDKRDSCVQGKCACTHDQGPAQARGWGGEPGKACHDKPRWALCRDKEFPVVMEKASPVSRQRLWCRHRVLGS